MSSIPLEEVEETIAEGQFFIIRGIKLQWLTVFHGLTEGLGSLFATAGSASVALLGFGLDSMIEVVSASIVIWRLTSIVKQGRRSLSELAGLRLIGVGFVALSIYIATDSIQDLMRHEPPKATLLGIIVASVSVILMPFLARAKRIIGGDIGSASMQADAKQSNFCAYLAGITLLGLALNAAFGWWWADPVAALIMTPIMMYEGVQALRGQACGCCAH